MNISNSPVPDRICSGGAHSRHRRNTPAHGRCLQLKCWTSTIRMSLAHHIGHCGVAEHHTRATCTFSAPLRLRCIVCPFLIAMAPSVKKRMSALPRFPQCRRWHRHGNHGRDDRHQERRLVVQGRPAGADTEDFVPPPSSSEAVAAVALLRHYCGAVEGSGLSSVDRSGTVEQTFIAYETSSKKWAALMTWFFSLQ